MVAGSVVLTTSTKGGLVAEYSLAWTSDAAGNVSGNSVDLRHGTVAAFTTLPGSGASAPTNLYDLKLLCDIHGVDILNDSGLNLSSTLGSHQAVFSYNADKSAYFRQFVHGGGYTLTITGAGATKSGIFDIYVSDSLF